MSSSVSTPTRTNTSRSRSTGWAACSDELVVRGQPARLRRAAGLGRRAGSGRGVRCGRHWLVRAAGWPGSCAATAAWCIEVSRPPRKGERRLSGQERPDRRRARRPGSARRPSEGHTQAGGWHGRGDPPGQDRPRHRGRGPQPGHDHPQGDAGDRRDDLRAELEPLTDFKLISACAALEVSGELADPAVAMRHALASLARRWLELHEEIKAHSRHLKRLTQTAAPDAGRRVRDRPRLSPPRCSSPPATTPTASARRPPRQALRRLPHPRRLRQDQAVTGSTGAATARPTPRCTGSSWSGCAGTHRPSPTSNAAPLRACPRSEIIRCLKRYVAREVYRSCLPATATAEPRSAA